MVDFLIMEELELDNLNHFINKDRFKLVSFWKKR